MKKFTLIVLVTTIVSCSNKAERVFEKDSEGNFLYEEKLDNSVVKRVTLDSDKVLSSVEYENLKKKTVVIYYYGKNGKLDQSIKRNTDGSGFIENFVYAESGKVKEKYIKTQGNEKLAFFEYDNQGDLVKKSFFREGKSNINSFVSYESGKPNLLERKSHFLYFKKEGNELVINPADLGMKNFIKADLFVLKKFDDNEINIGAIEGFKKNPSNYPSILKQISSAQSSVVRINLNEIENSKSLKCVLFVNDIVIDGSPNYSVYELDIENLDSLPNTNLVPIVMNK